MHFSEENGTLSVNGPNFSRDRARIETYRNKKGSICIKSAYEVQSQYGTQSSSNEQCTNNRARATQWQSQFDGSSSTEVTSVITFEDKEICITLDTRRKDINIVITTDKLLESIDAKGNIALTYKYVDDGASETATITHNDRTKLPEDLRNAIMSGSDIEPLLKAGADANAPLDNNTPLEIAILMNNTDAVRALIKAGAEINAPTKRHGTPISVAAIIGHEQIVEILLMAGATADKYTRRHYPELVSKAEKARAAKNQP